MSRQSDEIGAYEAKTHLAQRLRRVAAGERFMITQRGKPIAEPGPVHASRDRDAAEAARGMKAFRRKHPPITDVDIRALQEEGHVSPPPRPDHLRSPGAEGGNQAL